VARRKPATIEYGRGVNVVVVSDTHVMGASAALPPELIADLERADLIVHAGDIATAAFLEELKRFAPVQAVHGNADEIELQRLLPRRLKIEVLGRPLGVVHGDGEGGTTVARARGAFARDEVDVVVFGHSHFPYRGYAGRTLLFNPGSPTDRRTSPKFAYGRLALNELGRLTAGHVFL
jgi:putative phosphoesterase